MKLVIDANSIISVLIKKGKSAEILANFAFDFFAPGFLFKEIEKHKFEILRKIHRNEDEFYSILEGIKSLVQVVPRDYFSDWLGEAKRICPDEDDVEYFALALKSKCGIWSNDKKLKEQSKIKIYSTGDLIKRFEL